MAGRLHHLLDLRHRILRRFLVIKNIKHLDAWMPLGRRAKAGGALLQVGRVRIAVDGGDGALATQQPGQLLEGFLAALEIINPQSDQTLAAGGIP